MERLGVAGQQAEDIILRDYLLSAASVYNCRGGGNSDNPTEISERDISNVASALSTSNALKFLKGKLGEDRYGSGPIRASYMMLCSTEMEPDLDGLEEFKSNWEYPNHENVGESEYGSVRNVRFFTSSEAAVQRNASAINSADVFNNMVVARESYGHIDQDGYSTQLIYRDAIYSGPSALNATLAIKFAQAQIIKQETWIRNFRCTLST